MCRFSVEEPGQLQRTVSDLLAKKERQRMTQDLPEQPARQMPEVTRPQTLDRIALGELAEDGVYTVAQLGLCPVERTDLPYAAPASLSLSSSKSAGLR